MKANDFLQIFELGKAFKPPKAKRSYRKMRDPDEMNYGDLDISMLLHKKLEEADVLKKLLKDHEKINKEEKKEEKKAQWSMAHISYFLVATFPITAPLYVAYLRHMLS